MNEFQIQVLWFYFIFWIYQIIESHLKQEFSKTVRYHLCIRLNDPKIPPIAPPIFRSLYEITFSPRRYTIISQNLTMEQMLSIDDIIEWEGSSQKDETLTSVDWKPGLDRTCKIAFGPSKWAGPKYAGPKCPGPKCVLGQNVRGRNVWGRNVLGRKVWGQNVTWSKMRLSCSNN